MKIFKYLTMSLVASFALCACSDDDDWAPGEQDTTDKAGVYFPSSNETSLEVEPTETQMEFKVARLNTSGALSVPLTVTANDDDAFVIPATAEFNAGEAETTIVVDYSKAPVGSACSFTVTIPEEYRSLYKEFDGGLSYSFTVTRVKWNDLGTGTYTYLADMWGDGAVDTGLSLYQRDDNPSICKITNWLTGVEFTFTWNSNTNVCAVDEQPTGYTYGSYGMVYIIETNQYSSNYAGEASSYYDATTKTFNFNVFYFVTAGGFAYGIETFVLDAD